MNANETGFENVVAAGAKWMDENGPVNWAGLIDLQKFKMESPCGCVLGQVWGDYWEVVHEHEELWDGDAAKYGFNLPDVADISPTESDRRWWDLERTWAVEIRRRQQAPKEEA